MESRLSNSKKRRAKPVLRAAEEKSGAVLPDHPIAIARSWPQISHEVTGWQPNFPGPNPRHHSGSLTGVEGLHPSRPTVPERHTTWNDPPHLPSVCLYAHPAKRPSIRAGAFRPARCPRISPALDASASIGIILTADKVLPVPLCDLSSLLICPSTQPLLAPTRVSLQQGPSDIVHPALTSRRCRGLTSNHQAPCEPAQGFHRPCRRQWRGRDLRSRPQHGGHRVPGISLAGGCQTL
jgi:hypothetical protein